VYSVDGFIDSLGTTVSWLINNKFAADFNALNTPSPKPLRGSPRVEPIYFVPAFRGTHQFSKLLFMSLHKNVIFLLYCVGIASPLADARARGMFIGLTANTTEEQMAQAVLDSFGYGFKHLRDAIKGTNL